MDETARDTAASHALLTAPKSALDAVLMPSCPMQTRSRPIKGIDLEEEVGIEQLSQHLLESGFQATNVGLAILEIQRMLEWRLSDEVTTEMEMDTEWADPAVRANTRCTIWLSFTSNMMSSGLREIFVFLAKHKLVDVFVTSAGGIEEDFIKCLAPTYIGDFLLDGRELRQKGWNRIGNLVVPNNNYCLFEDWLQPILDKLLSEQKQYHATSADTHPEDWVWTPSKLIHRLGKEINDTSSLYYWCYKNNIPVFCPGITDGSLGDNLYFHAYRNPGLIVDVIQDIKEVNDRAVRCKKSGVVILGGGLPKHHTLNANLMRNGADFAVYVNTGVEYDGSDSGARPDEAVSWGKITAEAVPVKVHADATIVFPIITAATFAKEYKLRLAAK